MSDKIITILQLYPRAMNIYGDWGNALVLKRRLQWHGYKVELLEYNPGDRFPSNVDIIVGGGGQDSGQGIIQKDLLQAGHVIHALARDGLPMLMICGLYQLFGNFFKTHDGVTIQGIGLFDMETHGGTERIIGNITTISDSFGKILGYENHSGQTFLKGDTQAFGTVQLGGGNNGQDSTEGARIHNVLGSYLHGSLLPKNPQIADWLIEQAVVRKYGDFVPTVIDDRFAEQARTVALERPR